jgi:hypothetical protein
MAPLSLCSLPKILIFVCLLTSLSLVLTVSNAVHRGTLPLIYQNTKTMKKLLILAISALAILIILSSCSYEACATYSRTPLKEYGVKYTHANLLKKS